jgi:putative ABC transport system ATP-binding protein
LPSEWAARCENVGKVYRTPAARVEALRGVTASFPSGALTAVIGPSGSGKSSLLRLLAGLDQPTRGEVWIGGSRLGGIGPGGRRRLRRGTVGYLFQRPSDNFVPWLSLAQHLRSFGMTAEPEAEALLEELGIGARRDRFPAELSGGEQQRGALAQLLAGSARIILADEPTAELDAASARDVVGRMRARVEAGTPFVVATHDPDVIRQADTVIELEHGRLRDRRSRSWSTPPRPRPRSARTVSAAGEPAVAELVDVTKTYPSGGEIVRAVRDASCILRAGEVVGLIGRSGSGKTTLLTLLAGWDRPDSGRVVVGGNDPARSSWGEVGVVPQRLGLLEELSIRDNVALPARFAGALEAHRARVDELLEQLDLREVADRFPAEVSVGEQQRAAVARAVLLIPTLLLADEPSGHQDAINRERVFAALREVAHHGTCCLVATHDDRAAGRVDRVLPMADGTLSSEDP